MIDHEHAYADNEASECVALDDEHCMAWWAWDPDRRLVFSHEQPGQGYRCAGSVLVKPHLQSPVWEMSGTLEGGDLTLTPSINCVNHGNHGWVRGGKWVPA